MSPSLLPNPFLSFSLGTFLAFLCHNPTKTLYCKVQLFILSPHFTLPEISSCFILFFTWLPGHQSFLFFFFFCIIGYSFWTPKYSELGLHFLISIHSVGDLIQPHDIKCHIYTYDTQILSLAKVCPLNSKLIFNFPLNIPTWVSSWHLKSGISQTGILSSLLNFHHPVFLIQAWWQFHFSSCSNQKPWSHPWLISALHLTFNVLENVPISYHVGPPQIFPDCFKLSSFTSCALLVCNTVVEKP